jgi:hypothetical protein
MQMSQQSSAVFNIFGRFSDTCDLACNKYNDIMKIRGMKSSSKIVILNLLAKKLVFRKELEALFLEWIT